MIIRKLLLVSLLAAMMAGVVVADPFGAGQKTGQQSEQQH
jgi:hypothetical protein